MEQNQKQTIGSCICLGMINTLVTRVKLLLPRSICVHRLRQQAGDSVLLTFDDGPYPETTPAVLKRLKAFQARAIFFVVGKNIPNAPDVLRRIIDEGHLIGNHTFSHPNDRRMGYREYLDDLRRCQDAIVRCVGTPPRFHRPPMGQLSFGSLVSPWRLGLTTLMWTRGIEDWQFRSDGVAIARSQRLGEEVKSCDILVFHDERSHTLVALDHLLPRLTSRGLNLSPDIETTL